MIDWTRPYVARWRVFRVDRDTWADGEAVGGVDSVSVRRDATGAAPLVESGTLRATGPALADDYHRVVMTAEQGGQYERVEVATLLLDATGGTRRRGADERESVGHSVLWPAHATRMPEGAYVPRGADGAAYAARLLRSCCHAPVEVEGGFALADDVTHELGCRVLEAVWSVLRAGGHTIQLAGDGTIRVLPLPTEPALTLDQAHAVLLDDGISRELDWSGVPNRYMAVEGRASAVAVNDDPASPTSTATRGFFVDEVDDSPIRVGGETLAAYARRRLAELSVAEDERTYVRRWWPGVTTDSVVRGSIASAGLDGDMRVRSQSLECGRGIQVTERAALEVRAWPT